MQNDDDLRALAKIMAFMRAVSILIVLMHLYWYCYGFFQGEKWILAVVDRILTNFQRTAGLFSHPLYTKCFALLLLALSCLGTTGVKNDKITWRKIYIALGVGAALYFGNFWIFIPAPSCFSGCLFLYPYSIFGLHSAPYGRFLDESLVKKQPFR